MRGDRAFTLIEVMLAVAAFSVAAVGFAVALNDVLVVIPAYLAASCFRS